MSRTLSNVVEIATEKVNTPGVMTPILSIQPEDGMLLEIYNAVPQGKAPGVPIYAELYDENGDPLPQDTEIVIEYEKPSMNKPVAVSTEKKDISTYRLHPVETQQSAEYVDSVKFELNGAALQVREIDHAHISIDASVEIDWSQSRLYVDEKAVNRVPLEA